MSIVRNFCRLALRHPGKAAMISWWYITGLRVRAKGRFHNAVARLPFVYVDWLRACAVQDAEAAQSFTGIIAIHLHIVPETTASDLDAAIRSVLAQTSPQWQLIITGHTARAKLPSGETRITVISGTDAGAGAALHAALDQATTDYLVPLMPGLRLSPDAVSAYAAWIGMLDQGVRPILYGDQDEYDPHGRRDAPWFKPEWDKDLFLAQDYLSAACALPVPAARAAFANMVCTDDSAMDDAIYALLAQLAILGESDVRHVARATISTPARYWCRARPRRLESLRRNLVPHHAEDVQEGVFGTAAIRWPLPDDLPLVSIVVPTRDRLDLLQPCIEGVLRETDYPRFEIVIADNGSVEPDTLKFFKEVVADPRVSVVPWPHPYNYSAINNFAVARSRGSFVCLLNNDIEIIDGTWLSEMMRHACRPDVGAVGARLFYPDGSIQHAGVVVGMGNAAGHAHRALPQGEAGYFAHALVAREATAVTAACLVVSRALFDAVGGLDEDNLRIAYNDVDFCLKIRATGARNIYTPEARLIHHESKSRGQDMAPEHRERYLKELAVLQTRWDTTRLLDPTHHPVLDRGSETYQTVR